MVQYLFDVFFVDCNILESILVELVHIAPKSFFDFFDVRVLLHECELVYAFPGRFDEVVKRQARFLVFVDVSQHDSILRIALKFGDALIAGKFFHFAVEGVNH